MAAPLESVMVPVKSPLIAWAKPAVGMNSKIASRAIAQNLLWMVSLAAPPDCLEETECRPEATDVMYPLLFGPKDRPDNDNHSALIGIPTTVQGLGSRPALN